MNVLDEVADERERQDEQWGGAGHDDGHTLSVWSDLLGERATKIRVEAGLDKRRSQPPNTRRVRREAVIMAALAVALIESLDRRAYGAVDDEERGHREEEGRDE